MNKYEVHSVMVMTVWMKNIDGYTDEIFVELDGKPLYSFCYMPPVDVGWSMTRIEEAAFREKAICERLGIEFRIIEPKK